MELFLDTTGNYLNIAMYDNGIIENIATRSLSRLSLELASRLRLSFHLMMQAISEGNMLTSLFRLRMTASKDSRQRMSNIMSIASFSLVTHVLEQGSDPVAEVALDGDLSVFCTSSHSALDLQRTAKFSKVF